MEVPKKLLDKWKALRSPGDSDKIAENIEGGYKELVNRAFRQGKCSDKVFEAIAQFYEKKAELIKEFL